MTFCFKPSFCSSFIAENGKLTIKYLSSFFFSNRVRICSDNDENYKIITKVEKQFSEQFMIFDDFVSENEEQLLYEEARQTLETKHYQKEHWDDVRTNCLSLYSLCEVQHDVKKYGPKFV